MFSLNASQMFKGSLEKLLLGRREGETCVIRLNVPGVPGPTSAVAGCSSASQHPAPEGCYHLVVALVCPKRGAGMVRQQLLGSLVRSALSALLSCSLHHVSGC